MVSKKRKELSVFLCGMTIYSHLHFRLFLKEAKGL